MKNLQVSFRVCHKNFDGHPTTLILGEPPSIFVSHILGKLTSNGIRRIYAIIEFPLL